MHACGGTYYAGSKKVSYLPGFEALSTKTGLCTTTNKASVTRKVDFDVTPRCLVWEGNQSKADMFALSNKEGRDSWWVAKTNSLCCGMGISFLTTSDLDLLPSLNVDLVQKAVMDTPTYKGRSVSHRHFFVVSSLDPPRSLHVQRRLFRCKFTT